MSSLAEVSALVEVTFLERLPPGGLTTETQCVTVQIKVVKQYFGYTVYSAAHCGLYKPIMCDHSDEKVFVVCHAVQYCARP